MSVQVYPSYSFMVAVVVLTSLLIWGLWLLPTITHQRHFSMDSASYIEAAQNVQQGRGLVVRRWGGLSEELWRPVGLWPPGYPLLVAASAATTPLTTANAAVAVAALSAGLAVILLCLLSLRFLPAPIALTVVLYVACMPAFLDISSMAWSDAPHLAAVLGSLYCLLKWSENRPDLVGWVCLAGIAAGLALSFRHVGIALFPASIFFILLYSVDIGWRGVARAVVAWMCGAAILTVPLLLRNLLIFGKPGVYLDPSWESTPIQTLVLYCRALIEQLIPHPESHIPWADLTVMITTLGVTFAVGWLVCRGFNDDSFKAKQRMRKWALLAAYFLAYSSILVLAISRYGLSADGRYFIPAACILLLGVGATSLVAVRRIVSGTRAPLIIVGCIFTFGFLSQVHESRSQINWWQEHYDEAAEIETARRIGEIVPPHMIVLSTNPHMLRIFGNVHARQISSPSSITLSELQRAGKQGLLWGLVISQTKEASEGRFGELIRILGDTPDQYPDFKVVDLKVDALVFRYVDN